MRRLVICCDGTWNTPDQELDDYDLRKPTNVVKLARAIIPVDSDGVSQLVYYDTGVGTHNLLDKYLGGGTGEGLSDNILHAYRFLVNNYHEGDEIYLFGFSRGAFTVRSLGGLLLKIGLLPKAQDYWLPEGYNLYQHKASKKDLEKYRKINRCREVSIKMIGVWDTVGALGIPVGFLSALGRKRFQFHDVSLPSNVEYAYHALAIDEQRRDFKPAVWSKARAKQTIEQRWFPGVHTNIGGGYKDNGIANCALHWMLECAGNVGLEFDQKYLSFFKADAEGEIYQSRRGVYRLKKKHLRTLGGGVNESLHEATRVRFKADKSYRPKNLKQYLAKEPK